MKKGFTLAEVLITLGIIGVVASLTIPTLIQKQNNSAVEAKLKKIYSIMNQAILLSEIDNGPKEEWPMSCAGVACRKYYNQYIIPYLKETAIIEFESFGGINIAIYFVDGSALVGKRGYDYFFFPFAKNLDTKTFAELSENGSLTSRKECSIKYFAFQFTPSRNDNDHIYHYKKGFEPYKAFLPEYTEEALKANHSFACNKDASLKVWCTALIQLNNWKIPDDYPFRVR